MGYPLVVTAGTKAKKIVNGGVAKSSLSLYGILLYYTLFIG
jgi:hypothetical protein